ncbi:hypothetical protein PR202_gb03274 [Eleusine coracana subsp. coracana]|uniref:Bacterial surface antigen (D15) domain-containing protein n=1 Tax=Eleusine coracana subsp. coracana TaxID=191504 RepID=A0AAV5E1E5_ELECO|nr:hypothetical protein PR202_gb03194 [Eleusine coracana subsp. coracana]GJN16301.1 hypothetical protein PR202_gb03274 [Eleusine coracana subsp. coracana]
MWFLPRIFSGGETEARKDKAKKKPPADWDSHGLSATRTPVPLSRLDGKKRYKVSDLAFVDRLARANEDATTNADDPLFDMSTLRPGGVYTRSQLLQETKAMMSSGLFEQVSLHTKPKPDGTMGLTVSYADNVWARADRLKCINVGFMPPPPPSDHYNDMTAREMMEYQRQYTHDYQRRVHGAKRCILPEPVREELVGMVKGQRRVGARLLQRLRDRILKWYHDEGFVCAQWVNFGNLDTDEVVCEVVEGGITKLEYQFLDKLGNVVEGNTRIPLIDREVPQQASICPGGTVSFEHRNIAGLSRSLIGSVTSSNLLNPQVVLVICRAMMHLPLGDHILLEATVRANWVPPGIFLRYGAVSYRLVSLSVQVATELSVPISVKNRQTQLYAFAEHGTDLGSSKDVKGNPTEFFQRAGHGSSYGVGVKLGTLRAEYAVDHNAGTGSFFLRFGERF